MGWGGEEVGDLRQLGGGGGGEKGVGWFYKYVGVGGGWGRG